MHTLTNTHTHTYTHSHTHTLTHTHTHTIYKHSTTHTYTHSPVPPSQERWAQSTKKQASHKMTLHLEQLSVPSMEKPSGDLPELQRPQDAPAPSILSLKPPGLRTQQIGNLLLGLFKDLVTAELQMLQVGSPAPLQAFPQDPCRSHQSCSKRQRTVDQKYMRTEEKHFVSHFARSLLGDRSRPWECAQVGEGAPKY